MSEKSSLEAAIDVVIRERGEEHAADADTDSPPAVVDVVFNPPQPPRPEDIEGGSTGRG